MLKYFTQWIHFLRKTEENPVYAVKLRMEEKEFHILPSSLVAALLPVWYVLEEALLPGEQKLFSSGCWWCIDDEHQSNTNRSLPGKWQSIIPGSKEHTII